MSFVVAADQYKQQGFSNYEGGKKRRTRKHKGKLHKKTHSKKHKKRSKSSKRKRH